MSGKKAIRMMVILASVVVLAGFAARRASGAVTWVQRTERVPYTYYVWEEQTRCRTVRKAVTQVYYRTEQQRVTRYRTERKLVKEWYYDLWGDLRSRYVWQTVRIPYETYCSVRVPCTRVVYERVEEPYTVRVRVAKAGFRLETKMVAVRSCAPTFSLSLSFGSSSRRRPVVAARRPTVIRRARPAPPRKVVQKKRTTRPRRRK